MLAEVHRFIKRFCTTNWRHRKSHRMFSGASVRFWE